MSDTKVTLYTTPTCPFCVAAKNLLTQKNISFTDINVAKDTAARAKVTADTGHRTVPMIFVGDTFIGGFDNLNALNNSGELDTMLTK